MVKFAKFAAGIGAGLAKAATEDESVFLLTITGVLLGSRSKRLNGIGKVMGMYVVARRADQYMGVLDHNLKRICLVMHEGNLSQSSDDKPTS